MSASSTELSGLRRPRTQGRLAAALAIGILATGPLLAGSVLAQSDPAGAPRSLLPPSSVASPGLPDDRGIGSTLVPGAEAPRAEVPGGEEQPRAPAGTLVETLSPSPVDDSPRGREGIFIDSLEPIDPATVGVLTERDPGGFGGDVWAGLERRDVAALLRDIPADLASPTLRDLLRRLLLTSAAAPIGARPEAGTPGLLGLRAERLFALGETRALSRLLEVAPERTGDELLDRTRLQTRLITGREQEACRLGQQGVAEHGGVWWSRALIFCQLAAGEEDAALLGLDLLREQERLQGGDQADSDFLQLANALLGIGRAPDRPQPTALNLAMLAKLQARPDVTLLSEAPLGRSEQLLGLQSLPASDRVALAERAAAAGVLPGERLADFYGVFGFDSAALEGAFDADLDPADPQARALLFQALTARSLPPERVELLSRYLSGTRAQGVALAGLQAALPAVVELPPAAALARWAAAPGRTLFYGARLEQALAWFENAGSASAQWPEAMAARRLLWPYARLAGTPAAGWTDFDSWAGDAMAAGLDSETVALLAAALFGLGEPDALSAAGLQGASAVSPPRPERLAALQAAGQASRAGEALLHMPAVLGARTAGELHPLELAAILEALVSLDLGREARQFAMEALASRGL